MRSAEKPCGQRVDQAPDGSRTNLPAPGIDTGMGLERVAAIMQGVPSAYETDLLAPVRERVERLAGKTYGADADDDVAIRVVAEHARAAAFLIADGVVPANEGRGYVLRRVIRRGVRFARKIGMEPGFLPETARAVIALGIALNDRPALLAIVTDDLVERGLSAGEIVDEAAREMGGRGGGQARLAQAGGKDASRLGAALAAVPGIVARRMQGR